MTIRKYVNSNDPSPFMGEIKKMSFHADNVGLAVSRQRNTVSGGQVELLRIGGIDLVTVHPSKLLYYTYKFFYGGGGTPAVEAFFEVITDSEDITITNHVYPGTGSLADYLTFTDNETGKVFRFLTPGHYLLNGRYALGVRLTQNYKHNPYIDNTDGYYLYNSATKVLTVYIEKAFADKIGRALWFLFFAYNDPTFPTSLGFLAPDHWDTVAFTGINYVDGFQSSYTLLPGSYSLSFPVYYSYSVDETAAVIYTLALNSAYPDPSFPSFAKGLAEINSLSQESNTYWKRVDYAWRTPSQVDFEGAPYLIGGSVGSSYNRVYLPPNGTRAYSYKYYRIYVSSFSHVVTDNWALDIPVVAVYAGSYSITDTGHPENNIKNTDYWDYFAVLSATANILDDVGWQYTFPAPEESFYVENTVSYFENEIEYFRTTIIDVRFQYWRINTLSNRGNFYVSFFPAFSSWMAPPLPKFIKYETIHLGV